MMRLTIGLLLLTAGPSAAFQYWNDIRYSANLPGDDVTVRAENPIGAGIENYLLYSDGGVVEQAMAPVPDGPSTVEATVPGPIGDRRYYGFRFVEGADQALMPVRLPAGTAPSPPDLSRIGTDPVGDEAFGYTHLDLTDCRVSIDGDRIFASLENAGGGFPTNQGFTFFGYLLGIVDPDEIDPATVFALLYTFDQPGIIEPGLYRIEGTGIGDLTKIGDIEITQFPGQNSILMSATLADLLADPAFSSWYDPADPAIGVAGFTQRINIVGADEADRTPGATCFLRELALDPVVNELPILAGEMVSDAGPGAVAEIVYTDGDANCPIISEIVIDDTATYPLFPESLDYGGAVTYRSSTGITELVDGSWSQVVFRFSDDLMTVVTAEVTGMLATGSPGGGAAPVRVVVTPNPSSSGMRFQVDIPGASGPSGIRLTVHGVGGRTVAELADGPVASGRVGFAWDGRGQDGRRQPAGVYFYRLESVGGVTTGRITLAR